MPPNVLVSTITASTTGADSTMKETEISDHEVSPRTTFSASQGLAEQGGYALNTEDQNATASLLWWERNKRKFREPLAEFWGIFVLILFGNG